MIQSRGINDHKSLHFIPHYLTLLDSKYIHDLALFLAEMSHFSNSHPFITHTFFSTPLHMIATLRIVLYRLVHVCVLPHHTVLTPKKIPAEWFPHCRDLMTHVVPSLFLQTLSAEPPHTCYELILYFSVWNLHGHSIPSLNSSTPHLTSHFTRILDDMSPEDKPYSA